MSKGKRGRAIKGYLDLLDRPEYREILKFISNSSGPVTSKEINEFVLPHIKVQSVNDYLNYLVKVGRIKRINGEFNRRVAYCDLTTKELTELYYTCPLPSFDELEKMLIDSGMSKEDRNHFFKNHIRVNDQIENNVEKGISTTSTPLTCTTKNYIQNLMIPLKNKLDVFMELTRQTDLKITIEWGKDNKIEF